MTTAFHPPFLSRAHAAEWARACKKGTQSSAALGEALQALWEMVLSCWESPGHSCLMHSWASLSSPVPEDRHSSSKQFGMADPTPFPAEYHKSLIRAVPSNLPWRSLLKTSECLLQMNLRFLEFAVFGQVDFCSSCGLLLLWKLSPCQISGSFLKIQGSKAFQKIHQKFCSGIKMYFFLALEKIEALLDLFSLKQTGFALLGGE